MWKYVLVLVAVRTIAAIVAGVAIRVVLEGARLNTIFANVAETATPWR